MQEPSLEEALEQIHKSFLLDVHVSCPGKVQTYNPVTQTADVEPMVQRPVPAEDGTTVFEDLPVIPNVRVGWPRGGGYSLQWPLSPGDFVMLVFPTFDPSQWRTSGSKSPPGFLGTHVLGQPVALPCEGPATSPLTPTLGDEAVFEIATLLRLGGIAADFVALATKVQAYISQLEGDIATALGTITPTSGGAPAVTSFASHATTRASLAAAIAAVKVKAE